MPDNAAVARQLTESLSLALPPIALRLDEQAPDGVPAYGGRAPAGCLFWQEAAKRTFATATADHELCAIGVHTHALAEPSAALPTELGDALQAMAGLDYVREDEVAAIPVLKSPVRHVVYGPLAESPTVPDVVMLFADAGQGLVLTEALQRVDGGVPPALGRPACAVVPQAVNTARAAMSLGCCGARAYLDVLTDDVALWALAGSKLERYADEIASLADANRVLSRFHSLRRADVEGGRTPTVKESLARLDRRRTSDER